MKVSRVMRRFPVTLILLVQYVPLVLLPAISNDTFGSAMVTVIGIGLLTSVTVESILAPLKVKESLGFAYSMRAVQLVTYCGLAGWVVTALSGARSYAAQVSGSPDGSMLASVATPLIPWAVIGCLLAVIAVAQGHASHAEMVRLVVTSTLVILACAIYNGVIAGAILFAVPVGMMALLLRLVRFRTIVLVLLVGVIVWPVVYEVRNEVRTRTGQSIDQVAGGRAADRLNLDRQVALLDKYGRRQVNAPHPLEMIRYGLVPGVLDPGREPLIVGQSVNAAYGGGGRSSESLTVLGNVYLFTGWVGIVVYVGLIAGTLRFLLGASVLLTVTAGLMIQSLLWIDAIYPVPIATLLQGLVSLGVATIALRALTTHLPARPRRRLFWGSRPLRPSRERAQIS